MQNITNIIKKAISKDDVLWSIYEFFYCLEHLGSKRYEVSYCEDDDEKVASISLSSKIIGYIWRRYPLIFITTDQSDDVQIALKGQAYIEYIMVTDLDTEELVLDEAPEVNSVVSYIISKSGFSATDFWFYHVI